MSRLQFGVSVLLVLLVVGGCRPSSTPDRDVVSLVVRADVGATTERVVAEMTASDLEEPRTFVFEVADNVASGHIEALPAPDRVLQIVCYDAEGAETCRGTATIAITERESPAVVVPLIAPAGERARVAVVGSFIVSVFPASVEATPGDTVRIRAAVLDAYDDTLHVAVEWRSLGPARAVVDSTGLVTVVAPGTIPIVASVAGVGAAATFTISGER